MKSKTAIILSLLLFLTMAVLVPAGEKKEKEMVLKYPKAVKHMVADDYHGFKIEDPYRWLENMSDPKVIKWAKEQNKVTRSILNGQPVREKLLKRLVDLYNYPRQSAPFKRGEYYFYYGNDGLQPQDILYRKKGLTGKAELVVDPTKVSDDPTAAMNWAYVSENGRYLAYGISTSGDEQAVLHVRNIDTGKDLKDVIPGCRMAAVNWLKDGSGFYYSRFPDPKTVKKGRENFYHKIYFHKLGNDYKNDKLIYENPKVPEMLLFADLSEDERYLAIYAAIGTKEELEVYYLDRKKAGGIHKLFTGFDAEYSVEFYGDMAYVKTTKDAPMSKLVLVDPEKPSPKHWKTVIPEQKYPLRGFSIVQGKILTSYMKNAYSLAEVRDLKGKVVKTIKTPVIGSIGGFGGRQSDSEVFYTFTSFAYPSTIFRMDMATLTSEKFWQSPVKADVSGFTVDQVWYTSKDGTKVSMFLVHKKGLKKNGQNPTFLYGYGGFNISLTPSFGVTRIPFLEAGGIVAIPNLRGGGEYGREWHEAGMFEKKQNVFDDFITAAEYLIKEKWTCREKLAVGGGSNGGLLTGAVMVQRPDLFKAVVSNVPLLDMLRYHNLLIGRYWVVEYGSSENPEQFKYLKSYSPYHNVKKDISYPALLVTAGASDSRVHPMHAMKFAAAIQQDTKTTEPALLWVEFKSGHGQGKPLMKRLESTADTYTFLFWQLGMNLK